MRLGDKTNERNDYCHHKRPTRLRSSRNLRRSLRADRTITQRIQQHRRKLAHSLRRGSPRLHQLAIKQPRTSRRPPAPSRLSQRRQRRPSNALRLQRNARRHERSRRLRHRRQSCQKVIHFLFLRGNPNRRLIKPSNYSTNSQIQPQIRLKLLCIF